MKILLSLSIVLNIALAAVLFLQKNQVRYEKVIVETHGDSNAKVHTDEVKTSFASVKREKPSSEAPADEDIVPQPVPVGEEEMVETHQKMESERTEFMTQELGLSPEVVFEYQRLRNEYFAKTSSLWKGDPFGELSFESRRNMLAMEEKLHKDITGLLGKKNWDRYQKFRETYNRRGFEKQVEENQPFLFMGL